MPEFYPANIQPTPVAVWSTERLVDGFAGFFGSIEKTGAALALPFVADKLDQAALETFLAGEPYGRVTYVNNQWPGNSNDLRIMGGVEPPHIIPAYKIGTCAAMLFEGATTQGQQFGMEIINSLAWANIKDGNWTVMAVLRPTQSHFLPQSTLGHGEEGGTILSLEGSQVLHCMGSVGPGGNNVLGNVTPSDDILPGMLVTSPSLYPLADSHVDHVDPTGPNTGNVVFFGGGPIETNPAAQLVFSNPIARCYQSAGPNPGGWGLSNKQYFGGEIKFEPIDSCAVEVRPIVVSWVNNNQVAKPNDVRGFKTYQNEIVESADLTGIRPDLVTTGFVGRNGGSVGIKWTQCGDFWLAALMIWNVALTQAQRAVVSEALRARFNINPVRSTRAVPNVTTMGDSITQEYVTKGNYGWLKRLADKFPDNVRFLNQAAAGSVVTNLYANYPSSGSNEGQFPLWAKGNVGYSKTKNVFIMWGGGNDLIAQQDYECTFNTATDEISTARRAQAEGASAAGTNVLHIFPPPDLVLGAFVDNDTNPTSLPSGPSLTVVAVDYNAHTVTLSGNVIGAGVATGDFIKFRYHVMIADKRIQFKVLPALVTGVSVGVIYWIKTVIAIDRYKIAATRGGAVLDLGGTSVGSGTVTHYTRNATEVFGTPTTGGLQKMIADATAAGATKCYMLTNTPRFGIEYVTVLDDLNALIMGGGAGGYQAIDVATNAIFATQNVPPGHLGPGNADSAHLNEAGSQAVADQIYPILNAYLNP
jgi:lysophospholipase L1-like esterase